MSETSEDTRDDSRCIKMKECVKSLVLMSVAKCQEQRVPAPPKFALAANKTPRTSA